MFACAHMQALQPAPSPSDAAQGTVDQADMCAVSSACTGFAVSTSFFYQMKFRAHKELGLAASWADVMVDSGMLGVHMCGGPAIR